MLSQQCWSWSSFHHHFVSDRRESKLQIVREGEQCPLRGESVWPDARQHFGQYRSAGWSKYWRSIHHRTQPSRGRKLPCDLKTPWYDWYRWKAWSKRLASGIAYSLQGRVQSNMKLTSYPSCSRCHVSYSLAHWWVRGRRFQHRNRSRSWGRTGRGSRSRSSIPSSATLVALGKRVWAWRRRLWSLLWQSRFPLVRQSGTIASAPWRRKKFYECRQLWSILACLECPQLQQMLE